MKFKKVFILVLVCALLLNTGFVSAKSNENTEKVVFETKEITDEKILQDRMEKDITDDKEFKADCTLDKESLFDSDGKEYTLKLKSIKATSQKIKETVKANGDSLSEYSAFINAEISVTPTSLSGGGTDELWDYDGSGYNAKLYVRVTYLSGTLDTYPLYKITGLSGKLEKLDSSISLTKIDITQQCRGIKYTAIDKSGYVGPDTYDATSSSSYPSNNTYYNHTNLSSYYWNLADGSTNYVKGITKGYFSRSGSTWTASVTWSR